MPSDDLEAQTEPEEATEASAETHIHIPDLPLGLRIVLLMLGWLIVVLGMAGLLLPGLQGILLIVLGAAILSVASDTVHRRLEGLLERHPGIRDRLNRFRSRVHSRLSRK